MRRRSSRVTINYSPELVDLEFSAGVPLGRPAPMCSNPDSPAFSDSGDPSEVDDVRIVLSKPQGAAVSALLGTFFAGGKTDHAHLEDLVLDILRVLNPEFTRGNDIEEKFFVAADDAGEPDPDEE